MIKESRLTLTCMQMTLACRAFIDEQLDITCTQNEAICVKLQHDEHAHVMLESVDLAEITPSEKVDAGRGEAGRRDLGAEATFGLVKWWI